MLPLLPAPHPGVSKSGADANVRTPLPAFTENRSWSTEVASSPTATMEYVCVAVPSASVAVYVPTAVSPSATLTAALAPAEKTGLASLRSVTVAVMVMLSVFAPSVTESITVQTLESSFAPHPGFS